MTPGPSICPNVKEPLAGTSTDGETFHPLPRTLAGPAPVPSVAVPAFPFSPVKFSALMERVFAFESRDKLPNPIPRPLNVVMNKYLLY
jgi:hypothetical protein